MPNVVQTLSFSANSQASSQVVGMPSINLAEATNQLTRFRVSEGAAALR